MNGGTADIHDWELILPEADVVTAVAEEEGVVSAEGLMMLKLDYFSVDDYGTKMVMYSRSDLSSEGGGSVESDNHSWIDPDLLPRSCVGEAWPGSASDRSKLSDSDEKLGLGFMESDHSNVFEMENQGLYSEKLDYDAGESSIATEMISVAEKIDMAEYKNEELGNGSGEENPVEVVADAVEGSEIKKEVQKPVNAEMKALWWKLPIELVKFCVFRISPVWSISVAAAMLGVFIVRRRMNMMKGKIKALHMKVTMDDKKVDRFKNQAARLNEAFSLVRRVPIIRPSLPAPGSPWSIVSMR